MEYLMLFDTHTHLNFSEFDSDRDEILKRAQDQGLWMTNVGCDYESSKSAVELAEKFEKGVYATIGQHPTDSKESFDEEKYTELLGPKVVAVGECGLDYHHKETTPEFQKELFSTQMAFAQKVGLPLVIHCRDAYSDLIEMMKAEYSGQAIIHSFADTWDTAKKFLDMGFYLAFNAILIFDKTGNLAKAAQNAPSDKILIETDAPFLSPIQGVRNEPANVRKIAEKIAQFRNESLTDVSKYTFNNALKIYNIDVRP
jgi:TatD DNase family protein